jgi:DNA-directed RNA polymerase subunit RPC12/RpoP
MYETKHSDGRTGKINYTVWSDVFVCPECTREVIFWEAAVDKEAGRVKDEFPCPYCSANLTKRKMERAWVTKYDSAIKETIRQAKQVPVLINYTIDSKRAEKTPDQFDLALIEKIEQIKVPYWVPIVTIPKGDKTGEPLRIGITHAHRFYTKRNLWVLASVFERAKRASNARLLIWITASMIRTSKMYKYMPTISNGRLIDRRTGTVSGTLYIPSMADENSPFELLSSKISNFIFSLLNICSLMPRIPLSPFMAWIQLTIFLLTLLSERTSTIQN